MTAAMQPTWPNPDGQQVRRFLEALGKPRGASRLRGFFPSGDPRKTEDRGRKDHGTPELIKQWQAEGRGVYIVINDGGDTDAEITSCRALFCEWDDRPLEWQVQAWQELGLPEPTMQVSTGGKSVHNYWVLSETLPPERWRDLQRRLLEHADADRSLKNPSRVMRLPGCWYMHPKNQPGELVEIVHESGQRYSAAELEACLPELPSQQPTTAPAPRGLVQEQGVPLTQLLPRDLEQLAEQGAQEGSRNDNCFRLAAGALAIAEAAAAAGLQADGTPEQVLLAFASRCSPPLPEREALACLRSAESETRSPDPGWPERLRWQLNQQARLRQPIVPLMPATSEVVRQPEAPAKPAGVAQSDQAKGFIEETAALRETLDEGLRAIDAMPDVAMRSVGLVQLRRNLQLQEKDFLALVHQLAEHQEKAPPEDFDALLAYADSISTEPIIEDLLAVGLTLLAGEGGAGKSSVAYQLVEAVTTGGRFADQFQAKQGSCLVVQLDESVKDAGVKWRLMGFAPDKRLLHFLWKFNPMMFPELRAKVRETGAKVVILDSLLKVAGGTISPKDAEFGLLIYRLNQLAAELNIAIVCIHHLVKADKSKKRVEVTKDDIYGSAYVFNGAADVWGYWGFREDGNPEQLYALKVLKNRSSLVEVNTTYEFEGSTEDQRIRFRGMANRTITLDEIKTHRERVRAFLLSKPGVVFTAKQVNDHTGVGSAAYAKKLLTELYQARVGVDRKQLPSTGGRPPYGYFGTEGSCSQPRARVSLLTKQSQLPPLSLDSLSVGEGSKGVAKAQKGGDFVSLEPQGNTREAPDHGFGPALDEYLGRDRARRVA